MYYPNIQDSSDFLLLILTYKFLTIWEAPLETVGSLRCRSPRRRGRKRHLKKWMRFFQFAYFVKWKGTLSELHSWELEPYPNSEIQQENFVVAYLRPLQGTPEIRHLGSCACAVTYRVVVLHIQAAFTWQCTNFHPLKIRAFSCSVHTKPSYPYET